MLGNNAVSTLVSRLAIEQGYTEVDVTSFNDIRAPSRAIQISSLKPKGLHPALVVTCTVKSVELLARSLKSTTLLTNAKCRRHRRTKRSGENHARSDAARNSTRGDCSPQIRTRPKESI